MYYLLAALSLIVIILWAYALYKGFIRGPATSWGSLLIGFLASLPWLLYKREDSTKPTTVLPTTVLFPPTKNDVEELDIIIEKTIADPVQIQPREDISDEKYDKVLSDFINNIK